MREIQAELTKNSPSSSKRKKERLPPQRTARTISLEAHTETLNHEKRVTNLCIKIAKEMGHSIDEIITLENAASHHDEGKLFILPEIIYTPDRLSEKDKKLIAEHVVLGCQALSQESKLSDLEIKIASQHHERLNGNGYPYGLTEKEIHPLAKILCVADVYDAMANPRCYKEAFSNEAILKYFDESKGLYDRQVISALRLVLSKNSLTRKPTPPKRKNKKKELIRPTVH